MKRTLCSIRLIAVAAAVVAFTAPAWSADKGERLAQSETNRQTFATTKTTAAHRININSASKTDLEALPGVGPATADAIIAARPFKSVAELKNVKGIGEARFEEMLPHVTVKNTASQSTAIGAPAGGISGGSTGSDKPSAEAQEKNRAPKNARTDANVGAPETPGSGSSKPTAEAQEKNRSARSATATSNRDHSAKVDLNTASKEELEALPGIGPVKAQAIIDNRPYKNVNDVMKVSGIKEGTFDKIKDQITVK